MRLIDLSQLITSPDSTYFAHLQSEADGSGIALCLVSVGAGRAICRGFDCDESDGYIGDVLAQDGKPITGARVLYQRNGQFVAETVTDAQGRHSLWLPPGIYVCRYALPASAWSQAALPFAERIVEVKAGKTMTWETVAEDGETPVVVEREIAFVSEAWLGDWNGEDGTAFDWLDVLETTSQVCEKVAVRQLTTARFARPDVVLQLRQRGVNVVETAWSERHFATAYRNLIAMMRSGLVSLRKEYERANFQLRSVRFQTDRRVVSAIGKRYLADARAAAVFHAGQAVAFEAMQEVDLPVFTLMEGTKEGRDREWGVQEDLNKMFPQGWSIERRQGDPGGFSSTL